MPLHMHPYYRETYDYRPLDFPAAARAYERLVSLPIFPDMTADELAYVAGVIHDVVAKNCKIT